MCTRFLLISSDPVLRESTRTEVQGFSTMFDVVPTPQEAERIYSVPGTNLPTVVIVDLGASNRNAAAQWIKYRFANAKAIYLLSGKSANAAAYPITAMTSDIWDAEGEVDLSWGRDNESFRVFLGQLIKQTEDFDQSDDVEGFDALIGRSVRFGKTLETAIKAVESPSTPVLLVGEKGAGKRLFAKAIHAEMYGNEGTFVHIDCRAVSSRALDDLLQNKGSFSQSGFGGGTLFLEEVAALDPGRQMKILSFLGDPIHGQRSPQSSESGKPRLIAATAHQISDLVAKGSFNRNFFNLISELTIDIPPLRERPSDILLLAERFLEKRCRRSGSKPPSLSREVQERLLSHPWPGNIRELFGVLEAAVEAAGNKREILAGNLPDWLVPPSGRNQATQMMGPDHRLGSPLPSHCGTIMTSTEGVVVQLPEAGIAFEDIERAVLQAALDQTGNNVVRAAKLLRLGRGSLRYRLEKYGLVQPKRRRSAKRRPSVVESSEQKEDLRKAS